MNGGRNTESMGDRNLYEELYEKLWHESEEVEGHGKDLRLYQQDLIRHGETLAILVDASRRFVNRVEILIEENRKLVGRIKDLENRVASFFQSVQSHEKTTVDADESGAEMVTSSLTSKKTTKTEEESDDSDAANILVDLSVQNENKIECSTSSQEEDLGRQQNKEEDLGLGCRFQPSDQELIAFVRKKIAGENIPKHITERNLYGSDEPVAIFNGNPANELYFVTKIKKKFDSGKKNSRVVGNGTWKIQNNKCIYENALEKPKVIGVKKTLNFVDKNWDKNKKENKVSWIMHEYNVDSSTDNNPERWAICRIRRGPGNRVGLESSPPSLPVQVSPKRTIEGIDESVLPKKKRALEPIDLSLSLAQPSHENV